MKRFRSLYSISLLALMMFTGCQSDDLTTEADGQEPTVKEGYAQVRLRIAAAGSANNSCTRAWKDATYAVDAEMMNLWTVVIVDDATDKVVEIQSCKPTNGSDVEGNNREIDDITTLPLGTYRFYSFANIGASSLETLLGLPAGSVPVPSEDNVIATKTATSSDPGSATTGPTDLGHVYAEGSNNNTQSVPSDAARTATINGNGFTALTSTDNNGYDSYGIPMSNVQETTITSSTTFDLILVRMMAKIEIQLFNDTQTDVTVQAVTLSNITSNATDNLKLLPKLTQKNVMEVTHKDIQPNLPDGVATSDYTYTPATAVTIPANTPYSPGSNYKMAFYINESTTPSNNDGLFYLTLKLSDTEYRYALISNESSEWNYIARNDYRVIPVVLDDYKLELIPYDFPPIGVLPCSVKELEGDLYEMTFHDYGHFHLLPKVTKTSTSEVVEFSGTTPTSGNAWTLKDNDWSKSWFTATTKGGTWLTASEITSNGFYRDQTATVDADDAGGAPVWYANNSSPQWAPSGTTYRPFIFGYIADPVASFTTDKQLYHEFRIQLYVDGSYRRDMLYRFYMTLSADQMSYARGLHNARRHSH